MYVGASIHTYHMSVYLRSIIYVSERVLLLNSSVLSCIGKVNNPKSSFTFLDEQERPQRLVSLGVWDIPSADKEFNKNILHSSLGCYQATLV